jgi:hypothetical protein
MTKSPTRESPPPRSEQPQPRRRNVYNCDGEYEFPMPLDRARGNTVSGNNEVVMNHFVTPGFVLLVVALVLALDASLVLKLSSG